jgi:hypothetical protein
MLLRLGEDFGALAVHSVTTQAEDIDVHVLCTYMQCEVQQRHGLDRDTDMQAWTGVNHQRPNKSRGGTFKRDQARKIRSLMPHVPAHAHAHAGLVQRFRRTCFLPSDPNWLGLGAWRVRRSKEKKDLSYRFACSKGFLMLGSRAPRCGTRQMHKLATVASTWAVSRRNLSMLEHCMFGLNWRVLAATITRLVMSRARRRGGTGVSPSSNWRGPCHATTNLATGYLPVCLESG